MIAKPADGAERRRNPVCRGSRLRVAADRSGATVSKVLPGADSLKQVLEPIVDKDMLLVPDGHKGYPARAAALGVDALSLSAGEWVRGAFHDG